MAFSIAFLLIAAPIILGNRPIVILSGSMEPAYPVGSITYYKAAPFESISVGDAVTFKMSDGGELATHRVTAIDAKSQSFTMKGDANPSEDPNPLPFGEVVGKTLQFRIPYVGYIQQYVWGHWYLIVMAGVILLLNMLFGSIEESSNNKKITPEGAASESGENISGRRKEKAPDEKIKKKKKRAGSAEEFFSDF